MNCIDGDSEVCGEEEFMIYTSFTRWTETQLKVHTLLAEWKKNHLTRKRKWHFYKFKGFEPEFFIQNFLISTFACATTTTYSRSQCWCVENSLVEKCARGKWKIQSSTEKCFFPIFSFSHDRKTSKSHARNQHSWFKVGGTQIKANLFAS